MSGVIKAASTDQYTAVKLWTSADGLPKTDATHSTSGLSIKYQIGNAAVQSVTVAGSPAPASMSAGGAHADLGIYHRGNGWYVIGLADAVVATAGNRVSVWIELTDCDSAPAEIYVSGYDGSAVAVGASTFDHTSDEVTTDSASRTASQADVGGLATFDQVNSLNDFDPSSDEVTVGTNNDKTNYSLSTSYQNALVAAIDAALLDAGDATDLIASIVTRIGNTNVDEAAFAAAVKAALFDAGSAANKLSVNASGQVEASNMRGTDNAALAATAISNVVWTDTKAGYIDAAITSISAGSGPTAAEISEQIAADIETDNNGWDVGVATIVAQIERSGGMLKTLADRFNGITSFANWVRAFVRSSTPDATALSEINSGGGDFDSATDSLQAGAGGGAGSGERVVNITVVNQDDDVVPNAPVTVLTSGGVTISGANGYTNSSGVVTINLDDGTYKGIVGIMSGFATHVAEAFTVDEDSEAVKLTVSATTITAPSDPALATLTVKCIDEFGAVESGVTIYARLVAIPSSSTGIAFDAAAQSATSNVSGIATLTVVRLATYEFKRGTSKAWTRVTIADEGSTTVVSVIGAD